MTSRIFDKMQQSRAGVCEHTYADSFIVSCTCLIRERLFKNTIPRVHRIKSSIMTQYVNVWVITKLQNL